MARRTNLLCLLFLFAIGCLPAFGQVQAPVQPLPVPGGDLIAPFGLFNQYFPGVGPIYDGPDADPQGITNFHGVVAMGYGLGTATDATGRNYNVITDVRVYKGDYIGAVAHEPGGGTKSARSHGVFVEI